MERRLYLVDDTGSSLRSATDSNAFFLKSLMSPALRVSESMVATLLRTHMVAFSWARCVLQLASLNARILSSGSLMK